MPRSPRNSLPSSSGSAFHSKGSGAATSDRWFHDCRHEIHRHYAQKYLANDDDQAPGLWQYIHDAIIANCQRAADSQGHPAARQA